MDRDEGSPPRCPQCPAVGRRTVEVKGEESSYESREVGVRPSRPKVSIELSLCFCEDAEARVTRHDDADDNHGPGTVYAEVEASQKDMQRGEDKGTAAAQTQTASTKPKARTLVAGRQLIDGSEAAALRDQSALPSLTLRGTVDTDFSFHASITGKASSSAVQQDGAQPVNRKWSDISREVILGRLHEGNKRQYFKELRVQVEEKKQRAEKERVRNAAAEQKHNETMQRSVWGLPGGGAPNHHLDTAKRTKSLHFAGILPQEQIGDKAFRGTPPVKRRPLRPRSGTGSGTGSGAGQPVK